MSGATEVGTCSICGKKDIYIVHTYYDYDIKCECHSPNHFEVVRHCGSCTPVPPKQTTVEVKPK